MVAAWSSRGSITILALEARSSGRQQDGRLRPALEEGPSTELLWAEAALAGGGWGVCTAYSPLSLFSLQHRGPSSCNQQQEAPLTPALLWVSSFLEDYSI